MTDRRRPKTQYHNVVIHFTHAPSLYFPALNFRASAHKFKAGNLLMIIKRDILLDKLIKAKSHNLIKILVGTRRCGNFQFPAVASTQPHWKSETGTRHSLTLGVFASLWVANPRKGRLRQYWILATFLYYPQIHTHLHQSDLCGLEKICGYDFAPYITSSLLERRKNWAFSRSPFPL